jgi:hypothetical protein
MGHDTLVIVFKNSIPDMLPKKYFESCRVGMEPVIRERIPVVSHCKIGQFFTWSLIVQGMYRSLALRSSISRLCLPLVNHWLV